MYICKQNKFQHIHLSNEQRMAKAGRHIVQFENGGVSEEKLCKTNGKLQWLCGTE